MKRNYSWAEHLQRCAASGLSKMAYCKRHSLSYQMFLYHQRKLIDSRNDRGFHEVLLNDERAVAGASETIRIVLSSGAELFCNEAVLEKVIGLLHSSS
jgi:hypothetical protein